jgi:metallo-beta-lactamase family protein
MSSSIVQEATHPTVTFLGAAQSVTGSMHLLRAGGRRILLDCGLFRGRRAEERARNATFPFDPASVDAVVLSHAHTDHCGNLPNLVRQGFDGPIYCTPATRDLVAVMLADSARIQEEDAHVAAVVGRPGGALYGRSDAHEAVARCVTVPYDQPCDLFPDVRLRFRDAGHILGSAVVSLALAHRGRDCRVTFTGDLGRRGLPFLRPPSAVPAADLVICESTYGGRTHDALEAMAAKLGGAVRRTADRGGKVLVPTFSLGRTQVVLHYLRRWMRDGVLPALPLYVDSPLGAKVAEVYGRHPDAFAGPEGPGLPPAHYVGTHEESHEVSTRRETAVIVASGGMCEGGRILHHLRHHVDDPRACIVLVSYQAPHSVGHQLLERRPTVRFMGRTWNKWAEVVELNGFSGHADQNDFLALLGPAAARTGQVRLVHGEPEQSEALADALRRHGFRDVAVPHREESVRVA